MTRLFKHFFIVRYLVKSRFFLNSGGGSGGGGARGAGRGAGRGDTELINYTKICRFSIH